MEAEFASEAALTVTKTDRTSDTQVDGEEQQRWNRGRQRRLDGVCDLQWLTAKEPLQKKSNMCRVAKLARSGDSEHVFMKLRRTVMCARAQVSFDLFVYLRRHF